MTSARAIESNRNNAQKSCGPRTRRGRDVAKLNRLTHGLRSQGVVIPGEDPAAFQAFLDAWVDDWQPTTMARLELVEQCAAAAWRRKRCLRIEQARVAKRIHAKIAAWTGAQKKRVETAFAGLTDDPAGTVAALSADRAGIDRMLGRWAEVRDAAAAGTWAEIELHFDLLHLHGHCAADDEVVELRDASWRLFLRNVPGMVEPGGPRPIGDAGEAAAVADRIRVIAEAKLAALRALRETRPDPLPFWHEQAEAEAFEPRPEDAPLQRYEAQLSREFHRSLADLSRLTRTGDDLVEEEEAEESRDETAEAAEEASKPVDTKTSEEKPSVEKSASFGAGDEPSVGTAVARAKSDGTTTDRAPSGRRGARRRAARAPSGR